MHCVVYLFTPQLSLVSSYRHLVHLSRVYSGTTQLNLTRRRVELRPGSVHSGADATRRRVVEAYTVHQRSKIISERRDPVESICRARRKL